MRNMRVLALACLGVVGIGTAVRGQVVINEFQYDDSSTDDREFVELYNSGASPVDISGWTVGGRDPGGVNTTVTIPGSTVIPAGGYYVIGNTAVANVNQVNVAWLENDNETIELRDGTTTLIDAVAYEMNKGATFTSPTPGTSAIGPGVFGNHQGLDSGGTTIGRFVNGKDTNNNGRDFGLRPASPGASNNAGLMTFYTPPNPVGQTVGTDVPGLTGSFVNAKYIDPTVADVNNPNVIAPSPISGNRAIVAWDPSGGGNGVTSNQVFGTAQSGFSIAAYLDTSDVPQNSNSVGTQFLGSEVTIYGIGSGDALNNLTDLAGNIGLSAATLPASESANGTTGIAWVYERTAISGATQATQMLYLVDANDGGDSDLGGNTPLDWVILESIDISGLASDWFELGINIDSAGNIVANFNGNTYLHSALAGFDGGAFNVGYRENLQNGTDTTPDAWMRPATFTLVPEPGSLALLGLAGLAMARRRRA